MCPCCCWWCCKHHVAAQHVFDPGLHLIGFMLQAIILAVQVQQGQAGSRAHRRNHTATVA